MNVKSLKSVFSAICALLLASTAARAEVEIPIFDSVTYYDGYLVGNIPEDAPDEGCTRLYTYLNTVPLTDEQLDAIGEHLTLDVVIHAACDNYDRIGSVNLAFIPKGQPTYTVAYNDETDPLRIEIARFITPFMNKNLEPYSVPYTFNIDNLSPVLRNPAIREAYDVWVELEVFGVPYAAQQQVAGCKGCIDVFRGSLTLVTDDEPAPAAPTSVFIPIVTRRSDWRADRGLNNYNEACTDTLGRCVKTWNFNLPTDVASGRIVIMMSNHGANSGGEEYVRRMHYASFDDAPALEWRPGRQTCEPYRMYNTQANGIYLRRPQTDEWWQSFSNWCPGAAIPYQSFETGPLAAGAHAVKIEVPDAVFKNGEGYFPVSIYFQGDTEGAEIPAPHDLASLDSPAPDPLADYTSQVIIDDGRLTVSAPQGISSIELYDLDGRFILSTPSAPDGSASASVVSIPAGVYILAIRTTTVLEARKIAL